MLGNRIQPCLETRLLAVSFERGPPGHPSFLKHILSGIRPHLPRQKSQQRPGIGAHQHIKRCFVAALSRPDQPAFRDLPAETSKSGSGSRVIVLLHFVSEALVAEKHGKSWISTSRSFYSALKVARNAEEAVPAARRTGPRFLGPGVSAQAGWARGIVLAAPRRASAFNPEDTALPGIQRAWPSASRKFEPPPCRPWGVWNWEGGTERTTAEHSGRVLVVRAGESGDLRVQPVVQARAGRRKIWSRRKLRGRAFGGNPQVHGNAAYLKQRNCLCGRLKLRETSATRRGSLKIAAAVDEVHVVAIRNSLTVPAFGGSRVIQAVQQKQHR